MKAKRSSRSRLIKLSVVNNQKSPNRTVGMYIKHTYIQVTMERV